MRWLFLLFAAAALVLFFNIEPRAGFYLSFALLAGNFTTFCLLYDAPINRARQRVAQQLGQISGKGLHSEQFQRLQSMKITPTPEDKQFRLTMMSGANLITGILSGAVMLWGLVARFG